MKTLQALQKTSVFAIVANRWKAPANQTSNATLGIKVPLTLRLERRADELSSAETANRPKQILSEGKGSSAIFAQLAEHVVTNAEIETEFGSFHARFG